MKKSLLVLSVTWFIVLLFIPRFTKAKIKVLVDKETKAVSPAYGDNWDAKAAISCLTFLGFATLVKVKSLEYPNGKVEEYVGGL